MRKNHLNSQASILTINSQVPLPLLLLSSSFLHPNKFPAQNSPSECWLCSNQKSCKSEAPESCPLLEAEGVVSSGVPVEFQLLGLLCFWFSCWQLDPRAAGSQPFCLSSQCFILVYICAFSVWMQFKMKRFL